MTTTKLNKAERQQRMKKEPAPAPAAAPDGTRDELYAQAKALGITGASKYTKDQLVAAIVAVMSGGAGSPAEVPDAQQLADERVAEAAANHVEHANDPDAPKASESPTERSHLATEEVKAIKAWQLAGMKDERPLSPNYDYIAALYVGVKPKRARSTASAGGSTRRSSGAPRGAQTDRGREARQARKDKGGKRGTGRKVTDADLDVYVAAVREANADAAWYDELLYAHWIAGVAVSPEKFEAAWKRYDGDDGTAADEAQEEHDAEYVAGPQADDDEDVEGDSPEAILTGLARQLTPEPKEVTPIPKKKAPRKRTTTKK